MLATPRSMLAAAVKGTPAADGVRWLSAVPPGRLDGALTTKTVDLDAIGHNYLALQKQAGPDTTVVPTIKADAYGHGAVDVARTCRDLGARTFAVANLREAVILREHDVTDDILVMSYIPVRCAALAADAGVAAVVYDPEVVHGYREQLGGFRTLACHIKIDTGMGRMGVLPPELPGLLHALRAPCFRVDGVMTHYSCADGSVDYTKRQRSTFLELAAQVRRHFPSLRFTHMGNSAATLLGGEFCGNLARTGISLYGGRASTLATLPELRPCMRWTSEVAQVKTLPAGHPIGYGNTYVTSSAERVAVIPVGYSDGYRRGPVNPGVMLVGGVRCPIRGRVSMEKTVVSVDHLPGDVRVGDEVVLMGSQGDEVLSATEIADTIGDIDYAVFCATRSTPAPP